jgi:hypothetical protein
MRLPRFSIKTLMGLVLIVALDVAVFRSIGSDPDPWEVDFFQLVFVGLLPMANILAIALLFGLKGHVFGGAIPGSVVGFQLCGWGVILFWVISFLVLTEPMHRSVSEFAKWVLPPSTPVAQVGFVLILMGIFLGPTLGIALAGARFLARYRIRLIIEPYEPESRDRSAAAQTLAEQHPPGRTQRADFTLSQTDAS